MNKLLAKINFKLTNTHLFLILVAVLILASLGFSVKEYFESKVDTDKKDDKGDRVNEALEKGSNYDPFGDGNDKKTGDDKKTSKSTEKKNFNSLICDLEGLVIPGRKKDKRCKKHHHNKDGNHWPHKSDDDNDDTGDDKKKDDGNDNSNGNDDSMTNESSANPSSDDMNFSNNNNSAMGMDMSKYILKSEIVPPVCPKCPTCPSSTACPRKKPCPACPPCARCHEPAFECKKVPNYNAINASNINGILPMPRLNSFAQFN